MYIHLYCDRTDGIYLAVEADKTNNNPDPILNWARGNNLSLSRSSMGGIYIDEPEQIKSFLDMLHFNIQSGEIAACHLAYKDPSRLYHNQTMILVDSKIKLSTLVEKLQKGPVTVENFIKTKQLVDDAHAQYLTNLQTKNTKTTEEDDVEEEQHSSHFPIM